MVAFASNSRPARTVAFLFLLLLLSGSAHALKFVGPHGHHDYKREVESLEEEWRVAQLSGDVVTMDKLLSDDYVGISMTGQVNTKAQQLNRVRNKNFVLTQIDLGDMKVKLVGEVAVVTVRASVIGTSDGVPMSGVFRYTRVYQHLPNGVWKITNFEATRLREHGNVPADEVGVVRKPS